MTYSIALMEDLIAGQWAKEIIEIEQYSARDRILYVSR